MESRTRTSRLRGLAWLGAALLLPLALVHAREPSRLDPALALATFDEAWRLVDESPYDVRGKGIDWAAVRERYRPQAAAARDMQALRRSLLAMLETLGESHFSLTIRWAGFAGQSRVARQRAVNKALGDLPGNRVHALSIRALAPGE